MVLDLPTVGNKDDDPERKVVERDDAKKFAEQMGIQVFETSAKDNKNVEEVGVFFVWKKCRNKSAIWYLKKVVCEFIISRNHCIGFVAEIHMVNQIKLL